MRRDEKDAFVILTIIIGLFLFVVGVLWYVFK